MSSASKEFHKELKLKIGRYPVGLGVQSRRRLLVPTGVIFLLLSLVALVQVIPYRAASWQYNPPPSGWQRVLLPFEFGRAAALPQITGTINAVAVQSSSPARVWIAGDHGLLMSSEDDGRNWTRFDYDASAGTFKRHGARAAALPFEATLFAAESGPGVLTYSPASLSFPDVGAGTTSSSQNITVRSPQKLVTVLSIAFDSTSKDAASFDLKSDCEKRTLEYGQTCVLTVIFHPTADRVHTADILIYTNIAKLPDRVRVTGGRAPQEQKPAKADLPVTDVSQTSSKQSQTNQSPAKSGAPKPSLAPDLRGVGFTSAAGGWIHVDATTSFVTSDEGKTWRFVDAPMGSPGPSEIDQWQVGEGGVVKRRSDKTASWIPVTRGALDPAEQEAGMFHWVLLPPWYLFGAVPLCLIVGLVGRLAVEDDDKSETRADGASEVLASDAPLEPGDADVLNLGTIVSGLSLFLRHRKTMPPLTLAVTGEWGSGKSSLMNLLKKDLQSYGYRPVWFNAWHHQKEEHLLAALLQTVRLEAVPSWTDPRWLLFRWSLLRRRLGRNWFGLVLLVSAFLLIYKLEATVEAARQISLLSFLQSITGTANLSIAEVVESLKLPHFATITGWVTALTLLGRGLRAFGVNPASLLTTASSGSSVKDLDAQTGFRQRFAVQFRDVTEALGHRQLVIFIDDLDRCRPENVRDVLEAVNFLVTSGGCFIVLGMARAQVERAVGLSFKEVILKEKDNDPEPLDAYARKYLDKLINIEVPIPVPTPAQQVELFAATARARREDASAKASVERRRKEQLERRGRLVSGAVRYVLPAVIALLVGVSAYRAGKEFGPWLGAKMEAVQEDIAAQRKKNQADATATDASKKTDTSGQKADAGGDATQKSGGSSGASGGAGETANGKAVVPATPSSSPMPGLTDGGFSVPASWILLWIVVFTVLGLVAAGQGAFLTPGGGPVTDSDTFVRALEVWEPVVSAKANSPRASKRFINRVRYMAMRQRRPAIVTPFVHGYLPNRVLVTPPEKPVEPIHESLLVVLAALQQFDPALVASENALKAVASGTFNLSQASEESKALLKEILDAHQKAATDQKVKPVGELPGCWERYAAMWPTMTVR